MSEQTLEQLLIANDLAKLNIDQRVAYYNDVCKSLGLNPLTRPFDFITLNGKLQLYAKKDATDQLRRIYSVSVNELAHDHKESLGLYIVTARGTNGQGREDASTGAVSIKGLAGDALANAIMKAETKAKRRLTLSLCGLGILDETEIESAQPERMATIVDGQVVIDPVTKKSLEERPPETKKRGRPKKAEASDNQPWAGQVGKTTTVATADGPMTTVAVPEVGPNIHGVTITDEDVPFPGDDEKPEPQTAPPALAAVVSEALNPVVQKTDRLATAEERNGFMKRAIALKDKGYVKIREYLLKEAGVDNTQDIPVARMNELLDRLEAAEKAGNLKELLK